MIGEPKNIIRFNNSSLEFAKGDLEALLLHPEVANRKIVLLSIVGAFRRGKSFFLDYCLRYLYANVSDFYSTTFTSSNFLLLFSVRLD
jgi:atlastin